MTKRHDGRLSVSKHSSQSYEQGQPVDLLRAADQMLSDADQVSSTADKGRSATDQTLSTSDQAHSDEDQAAADSDQIAADLEHDANAPLSRAAEAAYELARSERDNRTQSRMVARSRRTRTASERDASANQRDWVSDRRDGLTDGRDAEAARHAERTSRIIHTSPRSKRSS
ncbi:MAG TPA: hypothetical protein VID26_13045 [Candidatus Limnocylindrales bacterium]